MATLPTLNDAIQAVIYKKVDNNGTITYVPYFPRTDAEWVSLNESINIHGTSESANTDMKTIIKALNDAIGATNATASNLSTASLQAQITYAISKINEQTGAFVFKGSLDPSQAAGGVIAPDSNAKPGWVYNVSTPFNITSTGAIQYVQLEKDAQYSAGTNVVIYGSGTVADPFKFDALAGDMGNHALTTEAIGYIGTGLDGRFVWGYVSEGQATHHFGLPFTFTNSLNSDYYLPIVYYHDAQTQSTVYVSSGVKFTNTGLLDVTTTSAQYAAAANTANSATTADSATTAASASYADAAGWALYVGIDSPANTGYILGDSSVTQGTHDTTPIQSGIKWATTATDAGTASKYLNVNITGNAATAGSVSQSLSVLGQSYNGSTAKTISKGNGLTTSTSGNTTTLSVGGSNSITVNTNSIAVKTSTGLTVGTNGVQLDTSGVTAGVYSAVQVDTYGRATVGAQSIVFANSTSDPDLNQLVVGGLAFISSSETAKTGTVPTNSMDLNN